MSNTLIQIKRSDVTLVPPNGSLANGEPAYSYISDKLFLGNTAGTGVIEIGGKFYVDMTQTAYNVANLAYSAANAAGSSATVSAAFNTANAAYDKANTSNITADYAYNVANLAYLAANAAGSSATVSAAFNNANAAFEKANTANITADYAYNVANLAYLSTNSAYDQANTARTHANAAFDQANTAANIANTKLSLSGGTVTGGLNVVGTLVVSGNTYLIAAEELRVSDPLIYLAGNNYVSDIVDIGFIANYVNATGSNVHTGFYREHEDKMYYLFNGYDTEPDNNHIGALSNNMTLAVLNADIRTSNLLLGGVNAISWIRASYNQANAALANATTTLSGTLTITDDLIVRGNTTLGDAATDRITINGNSISLGNNQSIDAGTLFIDAVNNRVGIGNTLPSSLLHISGTNNGAIDMRVQNFNTSTNPYAGFTFIADAAVSKYFEFYKFSDTYTTNTYYTNYSLLSDRGSGLILRAFGASGTINFMTGGANERMKIDATGNVGIGTSSPTVPLDVNGAITASGLVKIINSSVTNSDGTNDISQLSKTALSLSSTGVIRFANWTSLANPFDLILQRDDVGILGQRNGNSAQAYRLYNRYTDSANNERLAIQWQANTINISSESYGTGILRPIAFTMNTTTAMAISNTSNVGIGTASPAYKLEVAGSFAAQTKSFVINHQTKAGAKLRYGSLEGPENGVYVRGKTKTNVIELPDYWQWLIDEDSITVTLTPIGKHQKLYVDKIENNKVYIKNASKLRPKIECFYMINAERKDVEKLVVEF